MLKQSKSTDCSLLFMLDFMREAQNIFKKRGKAEIVKAKYKNACMKNDIKMLKAK